MRRPVAVALALSVSLGAAVAVPALSSASAPPPHTATPYAPVKGIALLMDDANAITDAQAIATANVLFPLLVSKFHATGVSFNFPVWQSSSTSDDPKAMPMTPTPQRLAALTAIAQRYHLAVEYRPYLYEGNLKQHSRPSIHPSNPQTWMTNYAAFLRPYLISANEAGVQRFSIALELTTLLPYLSYWTQLIAQAKTLYSGGIYYSQQHQPMESLPLTDRGYDAYQPINLASPSDVSVAAFTNGFVHNFQLAGMQATPADLTIEELGIPAVAGAYKKPYYEHYPAKTKIDRTVQEDWFAGACNAFWSLHLSGIYFWAIGFNGFTPAENNNKLPYAWYGTPTANVVASCFARNS